MIRKIEVKGLNNRVDGALGVQRRFERYHWKKRLRQDNAG